LRSRTYVEDEPEGRARAERARALEEDVNDGRHDGHLALERDAERHRGVVVTPGHEAARVRHGDDDGGVSHGEHGGGVLQEGRERGDLIGGGTVGGPELVRNVGEDEERDGDQVAAQQLGHERRELLEEGVAAAREEN
jgi:hypothetical protein